MKKIFFLLILFFTMTINAQFEELTTGVALDQISSNLSNTFDDAMDRADFSVAMAALKALGIIDAYKKANSELLDQAFTSLDQTLQDTFNEMNSLSNTIFAEANNTIEKADKITDKIGQIAATLPFTEKRSYITDYSPTVLPDNANANILITIKGVNLDKAEPKIKLKDGSYKVFNITGPTLATIKISKDQLNFDSEKRILNNITIVHETRNGKWLGLIPRYKDVTRNLIISTLPSTVGTYSLTGTRKYKDVERFIHKTDNQKHRGTNKEVKKVYSPLDGYKWDLRKGPNSHGDFTAHQGSGESARSKGIVWTGSTENGIILNARCDRIRKISLSRGIQYESGYVHLALEGPIYRFVDKTSTLPEQDGDIKWRKDISLNIPEDLSDFQLKISYYNGAEKIITGSYTSPDGTLKVKKNNTNLIISATPPKG